MTFNRECSMDQIINCLKCLGRHPQSEWGDNFICPACGHHGGTLLSPDTTLEKLHERFNAISRDHFFLYADDMEDRPSFTIYMEMNPEPIGVCSNFFDPEKMQDGTLGELIKEVYEHKYGGVMVHIYGNAITMEIQKWGQPDH